MATQKRAEKKKADAAKELVARQALVLRGVVVDDVPEDQRIQKGKDLVRRGEHQR